MKAQTFLQFAEQQLQTTRNESLDSFRTRTPSPHYDAWLNLTVTQYRAYLTETFPTMTLQQAAELTQSEA